MKKTAAEMIKIAKQQEIDDRLTVLEKMVREIHKATVNKKAPAGEKKPAKTPEPEKAPEVNPEPEKNEAKKTSEVTQADPAQENK